MDSQPLSEQRADALAMVNRIFDEREAFISQGVALDQRQAQDLFRDAKMIGRKCVGENNFALAFDHDRPDSLEAMRMILRAFPFRYDEPLEAVIDKWTANLWALDNGFSTSFFDPKPLAAKRSSMKIYYRNIFISYWFHYMKALHGRGRYKRTYYQLSQFFRVGESEIRKYKDFAFDHGDQRLLQSLINVEYVDYWPIGLLLRRPPKKNDGVTSQEYRKLVKREIDEFIDENQWAWRY